MSDAPASERFKIGDRVRLTDACVGRLSRGASDRWAQHRTGYIVAFCRDPYLVKLVRDGFRTGSRWNVSNLEPFDGPPVQVRRKVRRAPATTRDAIDQFATLLARELSARARETPSKDAAIALLHAVDAVQAARRRFDADDAP